LTRFDPGGKGARKLLERSSNRAPGQVVKRAVKAFRDP